ncbi:MAG TPA: RNA polymerase sigma factor [Clostridia bacterium]|nr:RNA polymerase sigma factor [Clostridia bacterium]
MNKEDRGKLFVFFANEGKKLNNYVRRKIQSINDMDAEDIVGDVMLNLFNKPDITARVENLAAYVYRSLYYKIIDYQRSNHKTISLQSYLDENGEDLLIKLIADKGISVSSEVERKEFFRKLAQAISSLDQKQRAVFIATEFEGRSFKELSVLWNEPIGTLLSRKYRTIKALQIMLKDYQNE